MVTKILKTASIVLVLLTLWACPIKPDCPSELDTYIPDLVSVVPIDTVYHVGDEIVYTAVIPSHIDSLNIDIYENTGVTSTMLGDSEISRLDGNYIEVHKGYTRRLGDENTLVAYLTYNPVDKVYEFQARIMFTQPGQYSIYPYWMRITFKSDDSDCPDYDIETSIRGFQPGDIWEFRVVP